MESGLASLFSKMLPSNLPELTQHIAQAFTSMAEDVNEIADVICAPQTETRAERQSTLTHLPAGGVIPYATNAKLEVIGVLFCNTLAAAQTLALTVGGAVKLRVPLPAAGAFFLPLSWDQRITVARGMPLDCIPSVAGGDIYLWAIPD